MLGQNTIVVPCYNEASRLDVAAFRRFIERSATPQFLLVNDGSRDRTFEALESLREFSPQRIAVHNLGKNVGKAEAVRQGVCRALAENPKYVGYWDADLATPLESIVELRRLLDERTDLLMVFGSRVKLLGRTIDRHVMRHCLGRVFATAASLVLELPVYDTQCGAKLFRVCPETSRLFHKPFRTNWVFDVEILARFLEGQDFAARKAAESRIYELPLSEWRDVAGSKVKAWDFFKAMYELALICWHYRRGRKRIEAVGNARPVASAPSSASNDCNEIEN
jgi:glycosyltransferase involved in cell wall biosynthesis